MLQKLIALFRLAGVGRSKKPTSRIIKEPMMQIIYNPFVEKWMWTRLNPATHTWEWMYEATEEEVKLWQGIITIKVFDTIVRVKDGNNG